MRIAEMMNGLRTRQDDPNRARENTQGLPTPDAYRSDVSQAEWWNRRGLQSGRGPRGWERANAPVEGMRTEEGIREEVCRRLAENGDLDARDIEVAVQYDRVILSGQVTSRFERGLAADIAASVPGVGTVVHDQLCVQRPERGAYESDPFKTPHVRVRNLRLGQVVTGMDRRKAGTVKELYDRHLVLERDGGEDLHIPYSQVQFVKDDRVVLTSLGHEADRLHRPDLAGM